MRKSPASAQPSNSHAPEDEPTIAKTGVRLMAMVYDGMLILALLFLVGMVLSVLGTYLFVPIGTTMQEAKRLPAWYQNGVMSPAMIVTLVGFYGLFWRRGGQTLGMQTWRLKTVTADGKLLNWTQSLIRILSACLVPMLCGLAGYAMHGTRWAILLSAVFGLLFNYCFCWFNRQGIAVHDMLSNTMTLKMPKIQHEGIISSLVRERREKKGG